MLDGLKDLRKHQPILQNTGLGWVIAGSVPVSCLKSGSSYTKFRSVLPVPLPYILVYLFMTTLTRTDLLKDWWKSFPTIPEVLIMGEEKKHFLLTTKILSDGFCQGDTPLKSPHDNLKLGWQQIGFLGREILKRFIVFPVV